MSRIIRELNLRISSPHQIVPPSNVQSTLQLKKIEVGGERQQKNTTSHTGQDATHNFLYLLSADRGN